MEKKLAKLFNFQRFEKNAELEDLIRETEDRYGKEISDEDLSMVAAAGDYIPGTRKKIIKIEE